MHRDLLKQAYSAMRHDLRRTLLTMAGMAWGIATVVSAAFLRQWLWEGHRDHF